MSVHRQITIHQFSTKAGLPREIADEILGFCFLDTVTAACRTVHREKMADIVGRFRCAWLSPANSIIYNDEYWGIHLERFGCYEDAEVLFQAEYCRACGNYKKCNTFVPDIETIPEWILPNTPEMIALINEAIPLKLRCCHQ